MTRLTWANLRAFTHDSEKTRSGIKFILHLHEYVEFSDFSLILKYVEHLQRNSRQISWFVVFIPERGLIDKISFQY